MREHKAILELHTLHDMTELRAKQAHRLTLAIEREAAKDVARAKKLLDDIDAYIAMYAPFVASKLANLKSKI